MRPVEDKGIPNFEPTHEISGTNSISFEFHKGNGKSRGSHRMPLGKPTPSKWDDAQKWLVGLSRGAERSHATTKPRNSNADDRRLIAPVPQKEDSSSSSSDEGEDGSKHNRGIILEEGETKKIDSNESFWRINKPLDESSSSIRSICVRDMGTEMTPIASQEPSRTPTPLRATTPSAVSPISSRSSTPGRRQQGAPSSLESYRSSVMCTENRNEPMPSGRAVGATRWSNREEEESNASRTNENKIPGQPTKPNPLEIQAMAWDEAERAKYMARYKREEVKIQAWENHEKRKAEMEMKRIEVKAERLKSRAQEKLANKLAATRRIAEEKRANAEAKLNEQAARTSERADYMRRTGHLPSFSLKMPSLCW